MTTTIKDVRTIGIKVQDQEGAMEFYRQLGFEVRMDAYASGEMRWLEVAPPRATVSLALVAGDVEGEFTETGVRFTVSDANAERTAMEATGVTVGEMLRWEGVPPMFSFDDPDGNRFTVVEVA